MQPAYGVPTETVDTVFHGGKAEHRHEARATRGKALRKQVARTRHAELDLESRADPIALLEEQERSRVAELVPVRHGRMMASPFAFFRGAAVVMASDLAQTPRTGIMAQICGDAHLVNFGLFGTPERSLVFDVNDFDETLPGPWEWDVKRLAASLEIAARSNGFAKHDRRGIVLEAARCYRETMAQLAAKDNFAVWYARLDIEAFISDFEELLTRRQRKQGEKAVAKAHQQDSARTLDKLTEAVDGARRIVSQPPLIVPLRDVVGGAASSVFETQLDRLTRSYGASLSSDRRAFFEQYRFVELARKVVGVGSVGTRCWIALFIGADDNDPLFLQIKEADASVLERFLGRSAQDNHGERVVAGQRLMQAASDFLLGWARMPGVDGVQRDYYVRQLRDWKGGLDVDYMQAAGMSIYGRLCGWTLARAHARSGDRVAIASYLGRSDCFDEAIATFAEAYAERNEQDHEALLRAIHSGRVAAEPGV
jgi:uncharacterized protein (DUF2252 family)